MSRWGATREELEMKMREGPRQHLISRLKGAIEKLPDDTPLEFVMQYESALVVLMDMYARPAEITAAMKILAELQGLFRQKIDITARRDEPEDIAFLERALAELPENEKARLQVALGVKSIGTQKEEQASEAGSSGKPGGADLHVEEAQGLDDATTV